MATIGPGHIKLGAPGDLRDYALIDTARYSATPANPFTPRLNTGEKWGELEGWAEWVQEDWQGGIGRTKTEEDGFLYAQAETRVPNQVILPPALGYAPIDTAAAVPGAGYSMVVMPKDCTAYNTLTIGTTQTYQKYSFAVKSTNAGTSEVGIWLYGLGGTATTVELQSDTAGAPSGTVLQAATCAAADWETQPYPVWRLFVVGGAFMGAAGTVRHFVIYPTSAGTTLTLYGGLSTRVANVKSYNGSAWVAVTNNPVPFFTYGHGQAATATTSTFPTIYIRRVGATLAAVIAIASTAAYIYTYNTSEDRFVVDGNTDAPGGSSFVSSVEVVDTLLYIGFGDSAYVRTYNIATNASVTQTYAANQLLAWGGYLWRSVANDIYYSADAVNWDGPLKVGPDGYSIRGMAGMNDYLHVSTDEGLYYIAPGDFVVPLTSWGSVSSDNGKFLTEHQGALYAVVNGAVIRIDPSYSILNVWIKQDDALPAAKIGEVAALQRMNNWLVAFVRSEDGKESSLWAFQNTEWHFLATLGQGLTAHSMYYDRTLSKMFLATAQQAALTVYETSAGAYYISVSDFAMNPFNDTTSRYMPFGWLETPRFYGDVIKLDKDNESVFVSGDNLATTQTVKVYWQSDSVSTWTLLGTVDSDGDELRWSSYTTRPVGKWIRLGFLLTTTSPSETPKVEAVVMKYMPMVNDRWRWQLPLEVSDNQQMPDGSINEQTATEMLAHLDGLVQRVLPFIYQDVDTTQYEVKVSGATRSLYNYGVHSGGTRNIEYVYTLTLEQVNSDVYTA